MTDEQVSIFDEALVAATASWGQQISSREFTSLRRHFECIVEANCRFNLTRITAPLEAGVLHYADSLALLGWASTKKFGEITLLDVGTGAGFPSVPIAIVRPDWSVTAIDATRKKVEFLGSVRDQLGLSNLRVVHAHSAHWVSDRSFDIVTSRALGKLAHCIEICVKFLADTGHIVSYKTPSVEASEWQDAAVASRKLGLMEESPFAYELRLGEKRIQRLLDVRRRKAVPSNQCY